MLHDFIIVGGGIYGITAAIELRKRNYRVAVINPETIPHHLAASNDVTKAVRMEYGSDLEYFKMVEESIDIWKAWNTFFNEELYVETGFLMLSPVGIESMDNPYEKNSYENLINQGYKPNRLSQSELKDRFPAFSTEYYKEANFNPKGGYVKSGKVVEKLAAYARSLGVSIYEGLTVSKINKEKGKVTGVSTLQGQEFSCGHVVVSAGVHTPFLVPELRNYMYASGHPVFWLKPKQTDLFKHDKFPVFSGGIATSGWYGFPYLEEYGIIKIAKHAKGIFLHPDTDDRRVTDTEVSDMRNFVEKSMPLLADAALVGTRRCLYTDTLDGHFWIDRHPEIEGLTISSGGSGHGMKMAPLLGAMAADAAEGKHHKYAKRHKWRHLSDVTLHGDEARFTENRK